MDTDAIGQETAGRRGGWPAAVGSCLLGAVAVWTVFDNAIVAQTASAIAFLLFLVLAQGHFGLRERMLLLLSAVATAVAFLLLAEDALPEIISDLSRAAYLAAFMLLVTSLRQGAFGSNSVLTIGRYLTSQPPGRRYVALHVGGHCMGVLLNFGAISLLGPMIRRGVEAKREDGPPELSDIRLRRQISALSRGFSWFNLWAPTAIAQAVVLAVVPGSRAVVIAVSGVVIASLLLLAGWAEDRVTGHRARLRFAEAGVDVHREAPPDVPWSAVSRFLAVAAALLGLAWIISKLGGMALVSAIMVAAVPVTILWMAEQESFRAGKIAERTKTLFSRVIPSGSPEAATLGLAGFVGILTATLVNRDWLATYLAPLIPGPDFVYLAVSAIIPLASCIGLPPMMTVTFLGGLLATMPDLQLNPSILALSLLVGWALNLTGSPFSATSLLLSRVAGIPGVTHSWRWNGIFSVISWVVAAGVMLTVARIL